MEKSTVLGIGLLAVVGVGAYVYLKGKKSTNTTSGTSSVADSSLGLSTASPSPTTESAKLLQDLGVTITPTTLTLNIKPNEGVPLLTTENIQKALSALGIDPTRSVSKELSLPNYVEAKKIASDMKVINDGEGAIDLFSYGNPTKWIYPKEILNKFSSLAGQTVTSTSSYSKIPPLKPSRSELLSNMTKKVNALGYKVLPNFDIEKM